ncbi:hypothetical protein HPB47_004365 [Ixodes persulcatus]|uniref:Uncharacterized protein n=1 Tax=Ixodes persulcatus TaxID=34615 RepID=A0AC60PFX1_IXOPE|nr:hypothetical protein HPB47_004365 [Ixodes persulcatus]
MTRRGVFFCCLLGYTARVSLLAHQSTVLASNCEPSAKSYYIGDRATCTFTRSVDFDVDRIPPTIITFKCNCRDSLCTTTGDFRCQEVKETMTVAYVNATSSVVRKESMEVTLACVCATSRSAQSFLGVKRTIG